MELSNAIRPLVSIIIINYNTFDVTANCIDSVIKYTTVPFEIILVDNNSAECDPELFMKRFPEIKLIKSDLNLGFSRGNNRGIEMASGEYILLLNSDTWLVEDSITQSVSVLKNMQDVAVLGCKMLYPDGRLQHTARRFRSIKWELLDLFRFFLLLLPYRKRANVMLGKYFKADFNCYCDWVSGAYFLFPLKLLSQFPGAKLDDRFFMYAEDQLWCWQFSEKKFKTFFYSGTAIIHINNASTDPNKRIKLLRTMYKNELEIMMHRKGKGGYYYLFLIIYGCKEQIRILLKSFVFRLTKKVVR